jgi:hypothetical protein
MERAVYRVFCGKGKANGPVQYLYADLGDLKLTGSTGVTTSTHFTDNIVRFGLNYRFWSY